MSTGNTPSEVTHLTAELALKLVNAYGDTDKALTDRALAVYAALSYGVDVKTMAADLADAARADATGKTPTVSAATLGYAKFASTVADIVGTDLRAWITRDRAAVAAVIRAGKKHGIGPVGKAIREAVAPIDKSEHVAREGATMDAVTAQLAEIKAGPAQRPVKSGTEPVGDGTVTGTSSDRAELTGPAALEAIRTVTAWLTLGGSWSPDLASAIAELTDAATTARKRGHRVTTATPADVAAAGK